MSQEQDLLNYFYHSYDDVRETSLTDGFFRHKDIAELVQSLKRDSVFHIGKAGTSSEGRELYLIRIGHGPKKIFLWSQMHGDEPTATASLFDIINFFRSTNSAFPELKKKILDSLTIYFLPMVNPDGAERFTRRNALDIDINRDIIRLVSPESVALKNAFHDINPLYAFNLHDQSPRYNCGASGMQAVFSFLAPAPDTEKSIPEHRAGAMKLICKLRSIAERYLPGHTARYDDEYEPRAFGDYFQSMGAATILIESGGLENDPGKQYMRRIHTIMLMSAFHTIAVGSLQGYSLSDYFSIPENHKNLYDVIYKNIVFTDSGAATVKDICINFNGELNRDDNRMYYISSIEEIGDATGYHGLKEYDFSGYEFEPDAGGQIHKMPSPVNEEEAYELLEKGHLRVQLGKNGGNNINRKLPVNLHTGKKPADNDFKLNGTADFFLKKNGVREFAVVNGYLVNIKNRINTTENNLLLH